MTLEQTRGAKPSAGPDQPTPAAARVGVGAGAHTAGSHGRSRAGSLRSWVLGSPWAVAGVIVALGWAVALRFVSRSALWLDEAQTVTIASRPLAGIPPALRLDGAPPLFYLLLHGWMRVVGTSPTAVRSLSGLFGVAALPVVWLVARRHANVTVAWIATLVLAVSPFAIYYSTEARMYSLVVLLVLLGDLTVGRMLDQPTWRRGLPVALLSGALLLTHYWSPFLLVAVGLGLLLLARRPDRRRAALRTLVALAVGGVLFLPWLPTFLFQLRHTGTPWAQPVTPAGIKGAMTDWGAAGGNTGAAVGIIVFALLALGLFARSAGDRVELAGSVRPDARRLAWPMFMTLAIAVVAGRVAGGGFADRYTSVAFPFFVVIVALGLTALPRRSQPVVLTVFVLLALTNATPVQALTHKTQGAVVAADLDAHARPGDLVVYCPDQLGPAVSRLTHTAAGQEVYPTGGDPQLVDWVDYETRNQAANPLAFTADLLRRAGVHDVYYVWSPNYRTFEKACEAVFNGLQAARPSGRRLEDLDPAYFEHEFLWRFPTT